jgi:hypothetical protein
MLFVWAVAKNIEGAALLMPLSQLSGPLLEKWFVNRLIWMPDIPKKDEIGCCDRMQWQHWLAFPSQQLALLFSSSCLQWTNIHHHTRYVVRAEQIVQRVFVGCQKKIGMSYLHCQPQVGGPLIQKRLEPGQVIWCERRWKLHEDRAAASSQSSHALYKQIDCLLRHI